MDADNRLIPIVDDDMGEGWKDPLTQAELMDEELFLRYQYNEIEEKKRQHRRWRKEQFGKRR